MLLIQREIRRLSDPVRARHSLRFFKTDKGEYGQGDKFLGLTNPQCRRIVGRYRNAPRSVINVLLHSAYHEERQIALFLMVDQYHRGSQRQKELLYQWYLRSTRSVNNWDLVDCSAYNIVGAHLLGHPGRILTTLARSQSVWERRIAIVATLEFIAHGEFTDTLRLATLLLHDSHDLIHKAVGWMLREVGKRNPAVLRKFLDQHAAAMPRTMLRYAIEKFAQRQRTKYLNLANPL